MGKEMVSIGIDHNETPQIVHSRNTIKTDECDKYANIATSLTELDAECGCGRKKSEVSNSRQRPYLAMNSQ